MPRGQDTMCKENTARLEGDTGCCPLTADFQHHSPFHDHPDLLGQHLQEEGSPGLT